MNRLVILFSVGICGCQTSSSNRAPTANAGPDQITYVRRQVATDGSVLDAFDPVDLDGSLSADPDGQPIYRFFWNIDTVPVGSHVKYDALSPNAGPEPTSRFAPDKEGMYGITLEVFDGQRVSSLDYVQITVIRANGMPVANAGEDVNTRVGDMAQLQGGSSQDPDGDYLSYRWELALVPPTSQLTSNDLVYPATSSPRLVPDIEGVYTLSLVVSDGFVQSEPDFVAVTVDSGNLSPVMDAGESLTITSCYGPAIFLDGSRSYDPEGDPLQFSWSVIERPAGSAVDESSFESIDAPTTALSIDLFGLYVFMLTGSDGVRVPAYDTVAIDYDDGSEQVAPVADAGGNRTVRLTTSCTDEGCTACAFSILLDGTASYDANHDPLTYAWSVTGGTAQLDSFEAAMPTLIGPALEPSSAGRSVSASAYVSLQVADCETESVPTDVEVTFTCEGEAQ